MIAHFFYAFIEKQDSMIKNSSITQRTSAEKSEKLVSVTLNERFTQKLALFLFAKKHFYNDRSLTKILASKLLPNHMKSLSFVYRKTTPLFWSILAARQCIPDVKPKSLQCSKMVLHKRAWAEKHRQKQEVEVFHMVWKRFES